MCSCYLRTSAHCTQELRNNLVGLGSALLLNPVARPLEHVTAEPVWHHFSSPFNGFAAPPRTHVVLAAQEHRRHRERLFGLRRQREPVVVEVAVEAERARKPSSFERVDVD